MVESDPPGGDFDASPRTVALRPDCALDDKQMAEARRMRRQGHAEQTIADHFHVSSEDVQIALAGLRTRVPHHRRRTLNVGLAAYRAVQAEQLPHEATWQTVDRLLTELDDLRRRIGRRRLRP